MQLSTSEICLGWSTLNKNIITLPIILIISRLLPLLWLSFARHRYLAKCCIFRLAKKFSALQLTFGLGFYSCYRPLQLRLRLTIHLYILGFKHSAGLIIPYRRFIFYNRKVVFISLLLTIYSYIIGYLNIDRIISCDIILHIATSIFFGAFVWFMIETIYFLLIFYILIQDKDDTE